LICELNNTLGDPSLTIPFLVAGDKSGGSQTRFYKVLIAKADQRFTQHLDEMKEKKNG